MLIFIRNTPRNYAWGSRDALPELLGTAPTGEPQAELWLGAHPGSPASVAKATPVAHTLIDLIASDPERYGVDGGRLPFLLKVLAIGAPLSLQVHPDAAQAAAGFAAEEAAGIPRDARERNYGDAGHKPELLVALSEVSALSGFRPLGDARDDFQALAAAAGGPSTPAGQALAGLVGQCVTVGDGSPAEESARRRSAFLEWAFSGAPEVRAAGQALADVVRGSAAALDEIDAHRLAALRGLVAAHAGDPGVLVSMLLHLVRLAPGEAIYLGAGQLHAYLNGIAVEVMAASDNVLRAGLTEKHVDIAELTRIVDLGELAEPRCPAENASPGVRSWEPAIPDFRLMRLRLREPEEPGLPTGDATDRAVIEAPFPLVLIATEGRARVERPEADLAEVANLRKGQSLYVSAGDPIELTGTGEVFLATVGRGWAGRDTSVSQTLK